MSTVYFGALCRRHPELNGRRYRFSRDCTACHNKQMGTNDPLIALHHAWWPQTKKSEHRAP